MDVRTLSKHLGSAPVVRPQLWHRLWRHCFFIYMTYCRSHEYIYCMHISKPLYVCVCMKLFVALDFRNFLVCCLDSPWIPGMYATALEDRLGVWQLCEIFGCVILVCIIIQRSYEHILESP